MLSLAAIAAVAEAKIKEAMAEGAFDNLPGAGKPLALDEDAHIPPEARLAHKILKNSGYLAPLQQAGPSRPEQPREPASALKVTDSAAGRTCSSLRRFAVMYGRVRRARGQGTEQFMDLALGRALEDSPYFGKVLDKF